MKTKILSLLTLFLLGTIVVSAGNKTENFKVGGNCDMCKKRIEKAANQVEGVNSADWNLETKMMKIVLDDSKTEVHKVHMAIAKAGYDTEMHRATDEAYDALPGCCQYQRITKKEEKMQMKMHPVHQH